MKRRGLACVVGTASLAGVTLPTPLRAQSERAKRVGALGVTFPRPDAAEYMAKQMRARSWEVGRDLVVIRRYSDGDPSRLPALARELVAERVDVILAVGDDAAVAAAKATSIVPIVMQALSPVELGLAKSLARPGGNVTGVVYQALDYVGKQLDLLRALQPGLKRVGFPTSSKLQSRQILLWRWIEIADPIGIAVVELPYPFTVADLDEVLAAAERERVQALFLGLNHALRGAGFQRVREWAIRNKVVTTAAVAHREAVLGFSTSEEHFDKLWYDQLDRVLRGANPAETPIQQPTRFEVVIHRGQLREMGLTVPPTVLPQATELID
jgi:putative tryptophan/tyrosine transport system substrate-binding protein